MKNGRTRILTIVKKASGDMEVRLLVFCLLGLLWQRTPLRAFPVLLLLLLLVLLFLLVLVLVLPFLSFFTYTSI